MLPDENELLTHTGPGTPMGELWRRFWQPVMLSSELPIADCAPVRVAVLGEHLVAFRDSDGRPGLVAENCPHRGASLFFGRNEEGGLRCVYHGWKFDVEGRCLDTPNAPSESGVKERIRHVAYPCREAAGMIWAYLGPRDAVPPLPQLPFAAAPESHRYVAKVLVDCNYLQAMEGDIDNQHASILHASLDPDTRLSFEERLKRGAAGRGELSSGELPVDVAQAAAEDTAPKSMFSERPAGITMGWRRAAGPGRFQWRVNHWLMPGCVLIANGPAGSTTGANLRVPVDDARSMVFRIRWNALRPLSERELTDYRERGLIYAELIPGTFIAKENRSNDYLIDRTRQKAVSVSGIRSFPQQDRAVTESMGPIVDRTKENLVSSDRIVVLVRRRLLALARQLRDEGVVPAAAGDGELFDANPADLTLDRSILWDDIDLGLLRTERLLAAAHPRQTGIDELARGLREAHRAGFWRAREYIHDLIAEEIEVRHTPRFPGDGTMNRWEFLARGKHFEDTFRKALSDFHEEDIDVVVDGSSIRVKRSLCGTLSGGRQVRVRVDSKYIMANNRIRLIEPNVDPDSLGTLREITALGGSQRGYVPEQGKD